MFFVISVDVRKTMKYCETDYRQCLVVQSQIFLVKDGFPGIPIIFQMYSHKNQIVTLIPYLRIFTIKETEEISRKVDRKFKDN